MKQLTCCLVCVAVMCLGSCTSDNSIKKLKRLSGTWMVSDGEGGAYEEWNRSRGDSMTGRSFKLGTDNDTIVFERMVLRRQGDEVWYIATVSGQNQEQPVAFRLTSLTDTAFIFENAQHDFPQRIIYHFINDDSIVTTIDGMNGNVRRFYDYYYRRMQ